jgi:hypothetical protein
VVSPAGKGDPGVRRFAFRTPKSPGSRVRCAQFVRGAAGNHAVAVSGAGLSPPPPPPPPGLRNPETRVGLAILNRSPGPTLTARPGVTRVSVNAWGGEFRPCPFRRPSVADGRRPLADTHSTTSTGAERVRGRRLPDGHGSCGSAGAGSTIRGNAFLSNRAGHAHAHSDSRGA